MTKHLTIYFNPFEHTIEENNESIRLGYEVMPIRIPQTQTQTQRKEQ